MCRLLRLLRLVCCLLRLLRLVCRLLRLLRWRSRALLRAGLHVPAIRPPTVPPAPARYTPPPRIRVPHRAAQGMTGHGRGRHA